MTIVLLLTVAGLVTGYVTGRARPLQTLEHAAWARGISGITDTRFPVAWGIVWLALNPGKALHSWRHRADGRSDLTTGREA